MWNDARTLQLIANTLAVLAILAFVSAAGMWVAKQPYFNLTAIELAVVPDAALRYVSPASVRTAIVGELQGNFFTIDLDQTRRLFESVPWVRHATVHRIWPNVLRVYIEEQQALALWNENQMINSWGEAFTANTGELDDDKELPHFYGPEGSESLVVQRYAELVRWFTPLDMHVQDLELSPRYAWHVTFANGLNLDLGRDPGADVLDPHGSPGALPFAARIQRFVQAWPTLMQKLAGHTFIRADLRYPHGFALALEPLSKAESNIKFKSHLKKH